MSVVTRAYLLLSSLSLASFYSALLDRVGDLGGQCDRKDSRLIGQACESPNAPSIEGHLLMAYHSEKNIILTFFNFFLIVVHLTSWLWAENVCVCFGWPLFDRMFYSPRIRPKWSERPQPSRWSFFWTDQPKFTQNWLSIGSQFYDFVCRFLWFCESGVCPCPGSNFDACWVLVLSWLLKITHSFFLIHTLAWHCATLATFPVWVQSWWLVRIKWLFRFLEAR